MSGASRIIHEIGGSREIPECAVFDAFRCWVCACESTRGMLRSKWMGASFTGQNKVRAPASNYVCESCVVVMSGKPPNTERMYSHLVEGREWLRVNKGQKPAMREFLKRPHTESWLAAIADSGQKHVIPWTPVNPPSVTGGRVLFEEMLVVLPSASEGWDLLDDLTDLLTRGATKEETLRGEYGSGSYQRCAAAIFAFEAKRGRERGSPWFELAVWLAQRDEVAVAIRQTEEKAAFAAKKEFAKRRAAQAKPKKEKAHARRDGKGKATHDDGGTTARGAVGVPADERRQHPETLGSDPGQDASGSADHVDAGRVGDVDRKDAPPGRSQLSFF